LTSRTDRNDDHFVDRAEFYARMSDVFYLNDDDKDGQLTESEYVDTQIGTFTSSDANGDGRLSEAEVMKRYE